MEHSIKCLPLILIVLIASCNSSPKNNEGSNDENHADDYSTKIDSLIATTSPRIFNGVILITQNGDTQYSRAYGYSNIELKTPITNADNFRIQSNSKQITAVLILKEFENGKIDLKSPIRKYLPSIKQTWADTVTVHQLLNMSSGIVAIDKPLMFEPGTDYLYSNSAYGLLGRIIQDVTGKEFTDVANSLFKELGMTNTYCYEIGKPGRGLVNGYRVSNGDFEFVNFDVLGYTQEDWIDFIPGGGMISNLHDLNVWDTKLHHGELLNPETYKLMTSYDITGQHEAFGNEKIGYGYGLRIYDKEPIKHIGHAGRGIGFASIKFFVPEKDVDVIVLENVYNADESIIYHFEKEIRKIVLNSNLVK